MTRVPTTYHTIFPAKGCARCFGCVSLLSLLFGAGLVGIAIWLSFGLRELYRGHRIEMPLDFSREGIYTQEVPVVDYRDLRLYCARKYGWSRHPDPGLFGELRFRCTIKDASGAIVESAEFNGLAFTEKSDGIDLLRLPAEVRDTTITVEIHVLRPVETAEGLPRVCVPFDG